MAADMEVDFNDFWGAAVVGNKIVFVPRFADVVLVFDTSANEGEGAFSTVSMNETVEDAVNFQGAAVVGSKVYFVPSEAEVVGVFDTAANGGEGEYDTISLDGKVEGSIKFAGMYNICTH